MTSCWEILNIDQTTDLKQIKSAYATILKSTRPDEKPDEFQQLHQAYKYALAHAKHILYEQQEKESANNNTNKTINDNNELSCANSEKNDENQNIEETLEQREYREFIESEYKELVERSESVIADRNKRNDKSEWQFLTQSLLMLEPQANSQLGLFILNAIDQHNLVAKSSTARKRKGRHRNYSEPNEKVNERTIRYLDTLFDWSGQLSMVNYYLGEEPFNRLVPIFEQKNFNNQQKAIDSVKGGSVSRQKNEVSAAVEYQFIVESYENVAKLSNFVTFVLIFFAIAGMLGFSKEGNYVGMAVSSLFISFLVVQWYGFRKKMKSAYRSMWVFASVLLLGFPLGTLFGALLMVNLYRARKFHDI